MISYLKKRPMIISAVGCVIASVCGFYNFKSFLICFIVFSLLTVISVIKKKSSLAISLFLVVLMTVSCYVTIEKIGMLNGYCGNTVSADICICNTSYKSSVYYISEAEIIKGDKSLVGTRLNLKHNPQEFSVGTVLNAKVEFRKLDKKYMSGNYGNGIYISGVLRDYEYVDYNDTVLCKAERLRTYIRKTVFKNMSYNASATVCALVFGDRSYFTDEFYDNVKSAGVAHAMVVSGMHLAIIVGLVLNVVDRFVYNSKITALIMFLTVAVVSYVCGFTLSILRAGVTYIIMAVGILLNRNYSGENALGAAVTFILIGSPFAIHNIGFQLSVLSTFGILAVARPISKYLETVVREKIFLSLLKSVVFSVSAMIMTLPVVISCFGYVSVVAVISNLLIDFPLNFCLCATVSALILNLLFPFTASLILNLTDYMARYINFVINYLGSSKFATVQTGKGMVFASVFVILFIFGAMLTCKKRYDMLKLGEINEKVAVERGSSAKWRLFLKRH